MQRLMKITPVFLVAYVLMMIPTYVLPLFGSNSSVATLVGGAIGGKGGVFPPQWWAHMFVLAVLVVIAWARGMNFAGKSYLPAIAFLAALFDMIPGLRMIPLVPTVFHLLTLVLGVVGCVEKKEEEFPIKVAAWRQPTGVLALCVVVAIVGTSWSVWSMATRQSNEDKVTNMFYGGHGGAKAPGKANTKADDEKVTSMFFGPSSKGKEKSEKAAPAPAVEVAEKPAAVKSEVDNLKPAAVAKAEPAPAVKAEVVAPAADTAAKSTVDAKTVSETKPVTNAVMDKPKKVTAEPKVAAVSANSAAVADFLSEGRTCMRAKRYDCAISQAKAALRLDGENMVARKMLAQAKAEQRAAMDSIEIQ